MTTSLVIGDRWPNKTSWKVFEASTTRAWLIIERHTRGCTCSYCRGQHGNGLLWMPKDRARGWRVLNFCHRIYVRWVWHSAHAERYCVASSCMAWRTNGDVKEPFKGYCGLAGPPVMQRDNGEEVR